ncbi:N-acetyltransferase GCN5 [Klebsiella pneumoniae]|nr:N-acetyltransferase GCN5 [Klebsiella pneumoniae]
MYTITDIAPTDAEFIALIAALDAWQETLYPAESNHLLDLSQLPPQTVIALAIRSPQGEAVGCGAIVLSEEGFGEMKRVYIDPQHRGQQLGEKLLAALEAKARQRDCHTLRLETGIHQHAAIALYTRNGYQTRCAFAPYQPDPLSVFMEKTTVCRSSFSSAINASSWRVLAPRRHTSQVVSQRHSSASGQAETC